MHFCCKERVRTQSINTDPPDERCYCKPFYSHTRMVARHQGYNVLFPTTPAPLKTIMIDNFIAESDDLSEA